MMNVFNEYQKFILRQYFTKPNARAEVKAYCDSVQSYADFLFSLAHKFSLEQAEGDQLDIIGSWVGLNRIIPNGQKLGAFGFRLHNQALPFGSKFAINEGRWNAKFTKQYAQVRMTDTQYRQLIKLKIAKNTADARRLSSRETIASAVNFAFDALVTVVDRMDMRLTLLVSQTFNIEQLKLILHLNLLPRPQGVHIYFIIIRDVRGTFGFSRHDGAVGFGRKSGEVRGIWARKLIIPQLEVKHG